MMTGPYRRLAGRAAAAAGMAPGERRVASWPVALLLCGLIWPHAAAAAPPRADPPAPPSADVALLFNGIVPGTPPMEHERSTDDAPGPTPPNQAMPPDAAFLPETEIMLAAVGDVIPHQTVQAQARLHQMGFRSLWAAAEPIFAEADAVYANLETPIAENLPWTGQSGDDDHGRIDASRVYTGYPLFNAPPSLAAGLKASGVTIVSTANNHALDRGALGIDLTIDALDRVGLAHAGSRKRDESADDAWVTIVPVRGMRIAWLACTYGTNGFADTHRQLLKCYEDQALVLAMIARLSARDDIDAIIVAPHFGEEYSEIPTTRQKQFARGAVQAGALAVLGSHPHVVQPSEWYRGSGGRSGFIIYSLGNFISNQETLATRSSLILLLNLARSVKGKAVITNVRYVPVFMDRSAAPKGAVLTLRTANPTGDSGSHWRHVVDLMGESLLHVRAQADASGHGAGLPWRLIDEGLPVRPKGYEGVSEAADQADEQSSAVLESTVLTWTGEAETAEGAVADDIPMPPPEGAAGGVLVRLDGRAEDALTSFALKPPEGSIDGLVRVKGRTLARPPGRSPSG